MVRKIGGSHVVWFPESNRWVEFREPAWVIYRSLSKGEKEPATTRLLGQRYGLPPAEARRFYREIADAIRDSEKKAEPSGRQSPVKAGTTERPGRGSAGEKAAEAVPRPGPSKEKQVAGPPPSIPARQRTKTRRYSANSKTFSITYGSPAAEYYLHRPLAHLETDNSGSTELTLMAEDDDDDDPGMLKHKVYNAICNHIHGMSKEEWMCHIHASALTDGSSAVLLPSASGSGKSTMAALLQLPPDKAKLQHTDAGNSRPVKDQPGTSPPGSRLPADPGNSRQGRDLFLVSDDFIPVSAGTLMAYPFPAAISIKEGSFSMLAPFYDPAGDADASYRTPAGKKDRYLRPRFPERDPFVPRPVTAMVFLQYGGETCFSMEKMDTLSALEAFHREAWVSQNPVHAEKFIDWFVSLDFYRLAYTDSGRAAAAIRNLFNNLS